MKLNRIIAGIMAVCVMGMGVPYVNTVTENNSVITASAEEEADYTEGTYEKLTYKNYGDYIEISGCDEYATDIVIPAEIDGVPVTSIGNDAFCNCSSLKSITIPDSVTSIGEYAFNMCENLISVEIPDSVTNIGEFAFGWTPWLGEKIEENPLVIVNNILISGAGCKGDIVIPDGVTTIQSQAFYANTDLTSIVIPDSVTSIGSMAFWSCAYLTSINIPKSVTSIGESAFYYCYNLTSIEIPDGVTSIEDNTFSLCGLTSIEIPDSVTSIGNGAFFNCSGLTSIKIPDSVTSIGEDAFSLCSGLTSIEIPDSVTNIEKYAFAHCSSLKSIEIPKSVSIITNAFMDCSELIEITILNPKCEIDDDSTISNGMNYNNGFYQYYFNGTIKGYENSTAQAYAEKYNRKFVSLGEAPEKEIITGDLNGNGSVNIADAVLLQRHLLGGYILTEEQFRNADLTGDGFVDSFDMVLMRRMIIDNN